MGKPVCSCLMAGIVGIVVALSGCSFSDTPDRPPVAPVKPASPGASAIAQLGLRAATEAERVALTNLGLLQVDDPAFAYDLPQGRALVGAEITYEGSRPQRHPGMLVTYQGKIALVSCDWDGSDALGVSVGNEGQRGVAALVSVLGEKLCQPWIVESGK